MPETGFFFDASTFLRFMLWCSLQNRYLSFINIYPYQPSPYQTKFIQILSSVPLWMKLIFTNQTKFYQTYHCQLIYPTHLYQTYSYPTSLRPTCLSFFSVIYVWQSPYLYPTLLLLLPTKRLNMWGYPVLVLASPVLHCFGLIEKQVLSSYSLHLQYSLNFWGQRHICMDRCLVNWDTYSNLGNKLCQHWTLNYPISWSQDGYWGARGLAG